MHLSDISWNEPGEEAVRNYSKGEEIEAVVLSVDPERERISLGIKQLDKDPYSNFVAEHSKGSIVKGTVKEVDAKAALVDLGDGVEGTLRASELSRDRIEDARTVLENLVSRGSGTTQASNCSGVSTCNSTAASRSVLPSRNAFFATSAARS